MTLQQMLKSTTTDDILKAVSNIDLGKSTYDNSALAKQKLLEELKSRGIEYKGVTGKPLVTIENNLEQNQPAIFDLIGYFINNKNK